MSTNDDDETENEKILKKLGFSEIEITKVNNLVEGLYDGLQLRRVNELLKASKTSRQTKQVLFLKEEIDKAWFQYVYLYNVFSKKMRHLYADGKTETDHDFNDRNEYKKKLHLKYAINPIDENILKNEKFFKELIDIEHNPDAKPLSFDDLISRFNKYNKISFMSMKIRYFKLLGDVESACEKIVEIAGEKAKNPELFPYYFLYIANAIHIQETRAIEPILAKKSAPKDAMSFLKPAFDAFKKFSNKGDNINVTIKKPLQIEGYPPIEKTGGKKIYNKNIMPRKVVVCRRKSMKKCKRAFVSCKQVLGKTRKYCRRSTKKSIAEYYAKKKN